MNDNRAEVIRDEKTGDSLQYAFIEFESKEACEEGLCTRTFCEKRNKLTA